MSACLSCVLSREKYSVTNALNRNSFRTAFDRNVSPGGGDPWKWGEIPIQFRDRQTRAVPNRSRALPSQRCIRSQRKRVSSEPHAKAIIICLQCFQCRIIYSLDCRSELGPLQGGDNRFNLLLIIVGDPKLSRIQAFKRERLSLVKQAGQIWQQSGAQSVLKGQRNARRISGLSRPAATTSTHTA